MRGVLQIRFSRFRIAISDTPRFLATRTLLLTSTIFNKDASVGHSILVRFGVLLLHLRQRNLADLPSILPQSWQFLICLRFFILFRPQYVSSWLSQFGQTSLKFGNLLSFEAPLI